MQNKLKKNKIQDKYKVKNIKRQDDRIFIALERRLKEEKGIQKSKEQLKEDLHTFLSKYRLPTQQSYLLGEQGEQNTSQLAQRNEVRSRDRSASKERDACVSATIEASLSGCTIF